MRDIFDKAHKERNFKSHKNSFESFPMEFWSTARIKYELAERGHTLTSLAKANGYHHTAGSRVLRTAWPAMEAVIAGAIGVSAMEIWPDRYDPNTGVPKAYLPRQRRRMNRSDSRDEQTGCK
jgi:Ner family transcriptional regulator